MARQLFNDGRGGASFLGSAFLPVPSAPSRLKFRRCHAQYAGPYGNGYEYDARIPPPPNYIAFPLPTPPVDAQFLPNTALPLPPPQGAYYPPQQQQPPFYPPMGAPQAQQPVGVFWDIENSTIPRGARVGAIVRRIRAVAQQFGRVRSLKAYGKVDVIEHYIDDLVAAGVEVLPVPDGKEMADKAIITDALLFALDSIDQPGGATQRGTVIIASGDKGFASVLGKLSSRGIRTVMLARRRTQKGGHIPTVITNSVDYTYDWEDLVPDNLRDISHEPAPAPPTRKQTVQPSPVNTKPKSTPPPSLNGDDTMPIWRPLGAQESSNGRGKTKAAPKSEASEPPQKKAKSARDADGKEAAGTVSPEAGKSETGSKYVLERLRNLSSAEQAAVTSLAGIRSEKVYPFEMEEGEVMENEESAGEDESDVMEPLTEIRGAPGSQSSGGGRAMWPHKWKTSLQSESKRRPAPKAQAPKRETVVWNPLEESPPSESPSEEPVAIGPFAFLEQAEQLLSSRTPLKGSEVADKALEMLQSALKGKPDVSKLTVAGGLGLEVDADAESRLRSAEMLAAARQQMQKISAEKDKDRADTSDSQASDQLTLSTDDSAEDGSLVPNSNDEILTEDEEERPKLTDAALQLAADMGFSNDQLARVVKAALLEEKVPVPTDDELDTPVEVAESSTNEGEGERAPGENMNVVRLKNQLRLVLHQEGPCAFTSLPGKYTKVVGHPLKLSDFGFKKLQDMSASFDDVMDVSISFSDPSVSSTEVREAAAKERQVFLRRSPRNLQLLSLITSGLRNLIHELLADAGQGGKTVGSLVYWITVCTNTSMESFLVAHGYLRNEGLPRMEQELATHKMLIDMADIVRLEYGTSERFKNVKCFLQDGAEPDRQADVFSSPGGKDVPYKAPDPAIAYTENEIVVPKLPVAVETVKEEEGATSSSEKESLESTTEAAGIVQEVTDKATSLDESAIGTGIGEQEPESSAVIRSASESAGEEESLAESEVSGKLTGEILISSEPSSPDQEEVPLRRSDPAEILSDKSTSEAAHVSNDIVNEEFEPSTVHDLQASVEKSESGDELRSQREGLELSLGAAPSSQESPVAAAPLEGTNADGPSLAEGNEVAETIGSIEVFNKLVTSAESHPTSIGEAADPEGPSTDDTNSQEFPASGLPEASSSTDDRLPEDTPEESAPSLSDPILLAQQNWELSKPSEVIDLRSADKRPCSETVPDNKVAAQSAEGEEGQRKERSANVSSKTEQFDEDQPREAHLKDGALGSDASEPDVIEADEPLIVAAEVTEADGLSTVGEESSEQAEDAPSEAGPLGEEGLTLQSISESYKEASTSNSEEDQDLETSQPVREDGVGSFYENDLAEERSSGEDVDLAGTESVSEPFTGEHALRAANEKGASSNGQQQENVSLDDRTQEASDSRLGKGAEAGLADKEREFVGGGWEHSLPHSKWRMFNHDVMMLVADANEEGLTLTVDALLARYREAFGRRMDTDIFRTEDGSPTTLRKRLSLVPGVWGVNENAITWEGKGKTLGQRLAVTSGLRQVLWTFLADAYPRRVSMVELVDELETRLPGCSLATILEEHRWTEGAENFVLEVGDFIIRHQETCTIDIKDPPPLLRDACLLGVPRELDLPLFKNLEQKGLRGEGEGPLYGWLEQCEWAPEWLDLVVGWFSERGEESAFTQGGRKQSVQYSLDKEESDDGSLQEGEENFAGGLTEIREWEEESNTSEEPLQLEARATGWEDESGEQGRDSGDERVASGRDDVILRQDDVSSDDEATYFSAVEVDDSRADDQGDVSGSEAGCFSAEEGGIDVSSSEAAYFSAEEGGGDISEEEEAGVAAVVSWDEVTALQDAAQARHEMMLILGSLQEGPHPQGVSYPKLRKVYRARTGQELGVSLEELLSEPRLIRQPHFNRTGLLSVHVYDHDKLRLNAAQSGLRQIIWWIAQQEYPKSISSSLVERRFSELCSLDLGTCLEVHGLGPQVNNRFKGWAALGSIKELIWFRATPKQQMSGQWSPPPVHLWKASPPPMMKDPPLLGVTPHEMEFELLRRVKEESGVSCWRLTHPTVGAKRWRKEYKKVVKKWKKARQTAGVLGLEREPRGSLRSVLYESEDESDGESGYHGTYQGGDQEETRQGLTVYDLEELDEGRESDTWRNIRGDSSADDEESDAEESYGQSRAEANNESDQEDEMELVEGMGNGSHREEESDTDQEQEKQRSERLSYKQSRAVAYGEDRMESGSDGEEETESDQEILDEEASDEDEGESRRWRIVQSHRAADEDYNSDDEFEATDKGASEGSSDGRDAIWVAAQSDSAAEDLEDPQGGLVSREWLSEESGSDEDEEFEDPPVYKREEVSESNTDESDLEDEITTLGDEQLGEASKRLWANSTAHEGPYDAHEPGAEDFKVEQRGEASVPLWVDTDAHEATLAAQELAAEDFQDATDEWTSAVAPVFWPGAEWEEDDDTAFRSHVRSGEWGGDDADVSSNGAWSGHEGGDDVRRTGDDEPAAADVSRKDDEAGLQSGERSRGDAAPPIWVDVPHAVNSGEGESEGLEKGAGADLAAGSEDSVAEVDECMEEPFMDAKEGSQSFGARTGHQGQQETEGKKLHKTSPDSIQPPASHSYERGHGGMQGKGTDEASSPFLRSFST